MKSSVLATFVVASLCGSCGLSEPLPLPATTHSALHEEGFSEVHDFGANLAMVRMFRYVPDPLPPGPRPLVVALHGCEQSAAVYHLYSGWSEMADRWGFVVLYPEQPRLNNLKSCWNWYGPWDAQRDMGEARAISEMVDQMFEDFDIAPEHVYVTGVSAGGFMAVNMAGSYPDVFAGASINAGGPYACTRLSLVDAFACMLGRDRTPQEWAAAAIEHNRFDEPEGMVWPTMSLWHGSEDPSVDVVSMHETMEQWTALHGIDTVPDASYTLGPDTQVREYHDAVGRPLVVTHETPGMRHGTQIDPEQGCGEPGTEHFVEVGVCTASRSCRQWGLDTFDRAPDPGEPPQRQRACPAASMDDGRLVLYNRCVTLAPGRWRARGALRPAGGGLDSRAGDDRGAGPGERQRGLFDRALRASRRAGQAGAGAP